MCLANAKSLDVSRNSQFSPIPLLGLAGSGRGTYVAIRRATLIERLCATSNATHFKMLLTQAVWFRQHICVSSQHNRGAEKLPHKTVVERPSTCARVSQNPVSRVCNSERPCLRCDETHVCCKRQGTERHPKRRILKYISPINLQGLEEWLFSNAAPRRVL